MVQYRYSNPTHILTSFVFLALIYFLFTPNSAFSQDKVSIPQDVANLENLTAYSADTKPLLNISLEKVTAYGDTKDVFLGPRILGVQVDANGQVFILDFAQQKVHAFNPDGSYQQNVGRNGRGPGEFQRATAITLDENNLYVLDIGQFKISIFGLENLEHIKDVNIQLDGKGGEPSWKEWTREKKMFYRANDIIARGDGTLFVIFSDNTVGLANNLAGRTYEFSVFDADQEIYTKHDLLSFDWTGGVLKTKGGGGTSVMYDVPYIRTSQFDFNNNHLIYGWSDQFLFKFYDKEGNYKQAFYYPFEQVKLNEKDIFGYYSNNQRVKENIQKDVLPETWPAFQSLMIDDKNRLWISTFSDDSNMRKWVVLRESGKLLAEFEWPQAYKIKEVSNGHVYTLQRDGKTGIQSVVKYQVNLK